jgi:protocatechuate 3,4-dioxygenase beta subunit
MRNWHRAPLTGLLLTTFLSPGAGQAGPDTSTRTLRGRVLDENNRPIPQTRVMVLSWKPFLPITIDGDRIIGASARSTTCKDGKFEIDTSGLEALGTVVAMAASGSPTVAEPVLMADSNLVVRIGTGVTLEGRVVDAKGQGVPAATVRFFCRIPGARFTRAVSAARDGRYRLAALPCVPDGIGVDSVAVMASAPGFAAQRWSVGWARENRAASTGDRVWTLDIPMSRGATLAGFVRNASGEPVVGARVIAWGSVDDIHINELDLTSECPQCPIVASTVSKEDGGYRLENVPLARRTNRFSPEHEWLGSVRSGAQKRFHGGLLVEARGHDPCMLELPCADREGAVMNQDVTLAAAARLTGRVKDTAGQPVAGARVRARLDSDAMVTELLFDRGGGDRLSEQTTGADGTFRFEGLPERLEGKPELLLWVEDERGRISAAAVVVDPERPTEVPDLVLREPGAGASFTGVAEGADGTPIAGAYVSWIEIEHGAPPYSGSAHNVVTGADGTFRLAPPKEGWALRAWAPGKATTIQTELSASPGGQGMRVRLGPAVPRGGTVLDAAGNPVEHARVGMLASAPIKRYEWLGTDRKGVFRIDDLAVDAAAEIEIAAPLRVGSPVEAQRAVIEGRGEDAAKHPLELLSARKSYRLDWLPTPPGITLNLQVLDEKGGSPVAGALEATLFLREAQGSPKNGLPPPDDYRRTLKHASQTGPGSMRVHGVVAGQHALDLEAPGYKSLESAPIIVKPSPLVQEVGVRLARGVALGGRVRLTGPRPGRGMLVVSATNDEITSRTFECCPEADGSFRIPVPWFGYTVTAFVREPSGRRLMQSPIHRFEKGASEIQNADLELSPTVALRLEFDQKLRSAGEVFLIRVWDSKKRLWFERSTLDANVFSEGGLENALIASVPEGEYGVQLLSGYGDERRAVKTMIAKAPGVVALTAP